MSYPKPKSANSEIDLKLGIKSSLPNATQAIVLSYLIWKCGDKKSKIAYSAQNGDGLVLKSEVQEKITELLSSNVSNFNETLFKSSLLENPLLKAQIEALIVGFELIWKLARFQFVDGSSFSSERTGGKRFEKIISYTSNIDILDLLVQSNQKDFLKFFYEILLTKTPSNQSVFDSFRKLLTVFSETAIYKIEHNNQDLIFDNLGIYKSLLEDNSVSLSDDKENKGASRILKSSANEGLNYYLSGYNGNVSKNQTLSEDELKAYSERVENFLVLTNIKLNTSDNQTQNSNISDTIPFPHNRIIFGAPGTGKSHSLELDRKNNFADDCFERVTFHPNYSYAQFVGTYKPTITVKETDSSLTDEQKQILSILKDKNRSGQEKYDLLYDKFRDDSDLTRLPLLIGIYSDDEFRTKKADGSYTANDNGVERNHGRAIRPYIDLNLDCTEEEISYQYVPGPFMRIYTAAKQNPSQNFLLLIEEINRANVAAVFGDVFQLLDRDENGNSEYPVAASEDIKKYLAKNGIPEDELKIPSNMYIWATMNSADQGVFPMDTAFKRRWEFEYIGIDENEDKVKGYEIPISATKKVNWNDLRKAINNKLITLGINEDKLLGPFFLSKTVLDSAFNKEMDFVKLFESKVLMYLFEDAAKMKAKQLFNVVEKQFIYSEVCKKFEEIGVKVFKFNDEDVVEEHDISSKEDAVPTEGKLF